ncbi:hypothetical protein [Nostoc sp.]|uniref:hypothetical protein n=1 Tax=Nostoc sp. TaxID=1180 RepID=UPI002FFC9E86
MNIRETPTKSRILGVGFSSCTQPNQHARQKINPIACPGLGTGIGRVPYTEAGRQMVLAYDDFLYPPKHLNCIVAAQRQLQIWEGGDFK